jgi:hypothetical protein
MRPSYAPRIRLSARAHLLAVVVLLAALAGPASAASFNTSTHTPQARYLAPAGKCAGDRSLKTAAQPRAISCLINYARSRMQSNPAFTFGPLRTNARLQATAQAKTRSMAKCNQWSFTPCGHKFSFWFLQSGYVKASDLIVGPNGGSPAQTDEVHANVSAKLTARQVMMGWLNDPFSTLYIVSPYVIEQGSAVLRPAKFLGHKNMQLWVTDLGAPRSK